MQSKIEPQGVRPDLAAMNAILDTDPFGWQDAVCYLTAERELTPAFGRDGIIAPPTYAGKEKSKEKSDDDGFEGGFSIYGDGEMRGVIVQNMAKANRLFRDMFVRDFFENGPQGRLASLIPNLIIDIPNGDLPPTSHHICELGHGIGDSVVQFSGFAEQARLALAAARVNHWDLLVRFMPTAVLQGLWDSRSFGTQVKAARIMGTYIEATGVVPVTAGSQYVPTIRDERSKQFFGVDAENPEGTKARKEALASAGVTFHPVTPTEIGVKATRVMYYSKFNVAAIREMGTQDPAVRAAMRRYLLCLGRLMMGLPQLNNLRGNMNLVLASPEPFSIDILYSNGTKRPFPYSTDDLISICRDARDELGISPEPVRKQYDPAVAREALKAIEQKGQKAKKAEADVAQPADAAPAEAKPAAGRKKK